MGILIYFSKENENNTYWGSALHWVTFEYTNVYNEYIGKHTFIARIFYCLRFNHFILFP